MVSDKMPSQQLHQHVSCELLISNYCNLNCSYCIAKGLPNATMSVESAKSAVDLFLFLSEGCESIEFTFSGGEPLCKFEILKDLLLYIKTKCNELGVVSSFVLKTNGTIWSAIILETMKQYSVSIAVSIDGDQKVHDKHRVFKNGNGSHDLVIKNISSILGSNIKCSGSLTVHPNTAQDLMTSVEFLCSLGLTDIDVAPVYGTVKWSEYEILAFMKELHEVANYIKEQRTNGNEIRITPLEKDSNHINGILENEWGCHAGITNLAFLPDGSITGCSALAMASKDHPEIIIGDINKGIDQVLINDLKTLSLADFQNRKKCKQCEISPNCTGGCLAINLATTGRSLVPPLVYCETITAITKEWFVAWD